MKTSAGDAKVMDVKGRAVIVTFPLEAASEIALLKKFREIAAGFRESGAIAVVGLPHGTAVAAMTESQLATVGLRKAIPRTTSAIPLILHCPACSLQHVDEGEWAERPHRTHECHSCAHTWRASNVYTVGVRELPPE